MTSHLAYGLRVWADGPIPGLLADSPGSEQTGADVQFAFQRTPSFLRELSFRPKWDSPAAAGELPSLRILESVDGEYLKFAYRDGSEFIVSASGACVWASWPSWKSMDDLLPNLRGPVFSALLRLRGVVSLHASAVRVGDKAIALIGPPGAGKSTTGAAFAQRGVAVLSDDIVPLKERSAGFWAEPGYPNLCLWPESVQGLYGDDAALPPIMAGWDKRYLDLEAHGYRFSRDSAPLGAIYVLNPRQPDLQFAQIEEIGGLDALFQLVAHTYGAYLSDASMRARDFSLLGRVAASVPVRRVTPVDDAKRVGELCDALLEDMAPFL